MSNLTVHPDPPEQALRALPAALTPLFGRARERAQIHDRLRDPECRLLTVVGVSGAGKTRLALEIARDLAHADAPGARFSDGLFYTPLAPGEAESSSPDTLATTILASIGLSLSGPESAPAQLANFLRERRALLLLDGFELYLPAAALVAALLATAPGLCVLATSQVPLGLRGEQLVIVDGLPTAPDTPPGQGAPELFMQMARASAPDLAETPQAQQAAAQIADLVGGLPLGIELAASWARFLSIAEIAAELAQSLDLLSTATLDLPDRQRGMRAVFHSSWGLLTPAEQDALLRLAAFTGSFTRFAALAVAETPLALLAALVNKSIVRRLSVAGETRYELPAPLRRYAAQGLAALSEGERTIDRHASYYLALVGERAAALRSARQIDDLLTLTDELPEIRAAWRHAASRGNAGALGAAADGLFQLYTMQSWFAEGAELFGLARAAVEPSGGVVWARLLAREGWFIFQLGRQRAARAALERAAEVLRGAGATLDHAWALSYLAAICSYLGSFVEADAYGREGLALAEASGDPYAQVVVASVLCQNAYAWGDLAAARAWGEQSLQLERSTGSRWSLAFSLANLGKVAAAQGELQRARQLYEQALGIRRALGDQRGSAICLLRLGDLDQRMHRPGAAARYGESLAIFRMIGNRWGIASALLSLGQLAAARGELDAATALLGEALGLARAIEAAPQVKSAVSALAALRGAAAEPEEAGADSLLAWARARAALTPEAAVATMLRQPAPPELGEAPCATPIGQWLTPREAEVLRHVAAGLTNAQIAERIGLGDDEVRSHIAKIYMKLGVSTRSAATRLAREHGLA